jgi:hypothetical protein
MIIAFVYVVGTNKNTEKGRKIQKTPSEKMGVPLIYLHIFYCELTKSALMECGLEEPLVPPAQALRVTKGVVHEIGLHEE